jgi:GGDEF domain-containing protein
MVFIATSSDKASQVLWAAMVLLAALITTFSLPPRSARYQVALMVVVYLLVTVGLDPQSPPLFDVGFVVVLVLGCYIVAWIRADQAQLLEVIADLATTDTLTGLLNRRGLKAEADIVHANATRAGGTTIVALVDLDGLKEFNDRHGHHAGDAHITAVTSHWRRALREGDLIARVGGDEFVMVLPRADEAGVRDLLTRIRDNAPGPWSQGWTVWAPNEPLDAAIERADALMYVDKARRNGGPDHSTHG